MSVKAYVDFTDFDGTLGGSFEPLPVGVYNVTVDTSKTDEVKKGATTEYVRLGFIVTDGELANRRVYDNFMIAGKGVWKLGALLVATGLMTPENREQFKFNADDLHGMGVRIRVSQREYPEGSKEFVNEIKGIMPLEGATPTATPAKAKRGGCPV